MPRRIVAALVALCTGAAVLPFTAKAQRPEPTPEPNFAVTLAPRPCAYEGDDPYEFWHRGSVVTSPAGPQARGRA